MDIYLQVQKALKKSQERYKVEHDKHTVEKTFKMGDKVWLYMNLEILQGPRKNIKLTQYDPFEVLGNVGDNS